MSDNPFVKPISGVKLVHPDRNYVVVLHRIEPGVTPDYCIHGKVGCHSCGDWCWLGSETYRVVAAGEVTPMCMECIIKLNEVHPVGEPLRNLGDGMGHG